MNKEMIWGVVRTMLAGVGGYFVAKGKLSADDVNTILGAIGTLFVAGWSIADKKKK